MNARLGEIVDMVSDYFSALFRNCSKQISLGHGTQTLIPGVVIRSEMRLDIVILTERFTYLTQ